MPPAQMPYGRVVPYGHVGNRVALPAGPAREIGTPGVVIGDFCVSSIIPIISSHASCLGAFQAAPGFAGPPGLAGPVDLAPAPAGGMPPPAPVDNETRDPRVSRPVKQVRFAISEERKFTFIFHRCSGTPC